MRRAHPLPLLGLVCLAAGVGARPCRAADAPPPPLRLVRTIPLPGVAGRLDHLALDGEGKRLAVAALGNGSVEVLDLEKGLVAVHLPALGEPQGVAFVPGTDRLAVACGPVGLVRFFAGPDLALDGEVRVGGDADNIRCEGKTGRLYVGHADGEITVLEGSRRSNPRRDSFSLDAHPEAFALEERGTRIFVNVPGAGHVAVLDRGKKEFDPVATWPIQGAQANYPMALDEDGRRLFVGCRTPARLVVLDTGTGKQVAAVEISGDVDDIGYDPKARRLYLSCGEGFLDVVSQGDGDRFERIARVATAKGARTSLLSPDGRRLYLAVPRADDRPAQVRVYEVAR